MIKSTHTHPNPSLNRIIQYGAAFICAIMVLSVPLQIALTLAGAPGGLFVLSALVTTALMPPVLMLTASSPAITIEKDGVWIEPVIWKRRFVPWDDVNAVKEYPLLPGADGETQRRAFVGRQNYTAPEGIMLVIPGLPLQYRIAAFFAGEPGRGIVALTNRTHTEYP
ncbi:MAG: hypothetical protein AAF653_14865, partial [Chloroflexota bacterium]